MVTRKEPKAILIPHKIDFKSRTLKETKKVIREWSRDQFIKLTEEL